jgi:hypothetical protein
MTWIFIARRDGRVFKTLQDLINDYTWEIRREDFGGLLGVAGGAVRGVERLQGLL